MSALTYEPQCWQVGTSHRMTICRAVPTNLEAPSAGPDLPYVTLCVGRGGYERGATVSKQFGGAGSDQKTMLWPWDYALPCQDAPPVNEEATAKADGDDTFAIVSVPEQVETVVREVDSELREALKRDGLQAATTNDDVDTLTLAQYDAVYSMDQRRSEVHILLQDGGIRGRLSKVLDPIH